MKIKYNQPPTAEEKAEYKRSARLFQDNVYYVQCLRYLDWFTHEAAKSPEVYPIFDELNLPFEEVSRFIWEAIKGKLYNYIYEIPDDIAKNNANKYCVAFMGVPQRNLFYKDEITEQVLDYIGMFPREEHFRVYAGYYRVADEICKTIIFQVDLETLQEIPCEGEMYHYIATSYAIIERRKSLFSSRAPDEHDFHYYFPSFEYPKVWAMKALAEQHKINYGVLRMKKPLKLFRNIDFDRFICSNPTQCVKYDNIISMNDSIESMNGSYPEKFLLNDYYLGMSGDDTEIIAVPRIKKLCAWTYDDVAKERLLLE